jgi:hypothetical protein
MWALGRSVIRDKMMWRRGRKLQVGDQPLVKRDNRWGLGLFIVSVVLYTGAVPLQGL